MSGYIHFTEEQKQRANAVDLVDFLKRQGEQLTRSGREWRWKRYDSVTVRGNRWFRHSSRQGGLAIDFVQEFYGLPFPDTVSLLLGGEQGVAFKQSDKEASELERGKFIIPEANTDMHRVYAYLLKQRYIDQNILTHFVREKKIYEDREYHNAIFVGFDENGVARHAHKRGTYSRTANYRGNVEGSNPEFSFHYIGTSNTLYVFEAPIDMLSYISLNRRCWQQNSYVTLNGVAEHAMLHVLSQNKHLNNVVLCLDHDPAGIEAAGRLSEILRKNEYNKISLLQSTCKDWNEDVKAQHGITPMSAQPHPKIEACHKLCDELRDLCSDIKFIKNPHGIMLEHYNSFISHIQNSKGIPGKEAVVTESLQSIAAYALMAVMEQYSHLEKPMAIDALTDKLYASYYPHQDKGKLKSKVDNLQHDVNIVNELLRDAGICTLDEKKKLIVSYMSLVLSCVRIHIFIALGCHLQKSEMLQEVTLQKQNKNQMVYKQVNDAELAKYGLNLT